MKPVRLWSPFSSWVYTAFVREWRFNAFAEFERLGSAIANSPIVTEHDVATVFVGAIYTL
jgi:outer membrane scaffolding protein for murein synthesis (MipA/OmpV family)